MDDSINKDKFKIFPVTSSLESIKENIYIHSNTQISKEQIINQAIKFHLEGKITEAARYYQSFIENGFIDSNVFCNFGLILRDLGQLEDAEMITRKAIKLKPKCPEFHANLGIILKDRRKLIEAEVSARKALELNPNIAQFHANLGMVLKDLGKLEEAKLSIIKEIELKPGSAYSYSNLGSILRDLGELNDAEIEARKAIKLKPDYSLAHLNLGTILKDLGKLKEAEKSIRKAIKLNSLSAESHCNLGAILKDLGKLKEAEESTKKAIDIKSDFADAYSNLGSILIDLGKLKEAELSLLKAIKLNSNLSIAYFNLSTLKYSINYETWKNKLFSKEILNNKASKDKIDIYFARSNILHNEKNFEGSSENLIVANQLKLLLKPSNADFLINKSNALLIESEQQIIINNKSSNAYGNIFIVGMPRSGSTLIESILSTNKIVKDLGEVNYLEESFLEFNKSHEKSNLAKIYWNKINKINKINKSYAITTDKNLYNYQYTGIISKHIPNAKIIHCFRNPLDNILSIYRAHFSQGNEYASSLVDSLRVYLDQEETMKKYKDKFSSNIYELNYDFLVKNPFDEIRSLIGWLGWEWNDEYLWPHLNTRSVSTASNIQVRSPINSKSIGVWENYKDMLKPAIEILVKLNRYPDLFL